MLINTLSFWYLVSFAGLGAVMFQKALLHYPEDKLHTTSSQYIYSLLEQLNEGAVVSDAQGHIRLVNQQMCNLLGYHPSELLERNWSELLVEDAYYEQLITTKLQSGKVFRGVAQMITKTANVITVELRIQQLSGGEYLTYVYDEVMTEPVAFEPTQQSAVGREFIHLNNQIPNGALIINVLKNGQLKIQYANEGMSLLTGVRVENLYREPQLLFSRLHPHDRATFLDTLLTLNPHATFQKRAVRFLHPEKGDIWLEVHGRSQHRPNGDITWFTLYRDITPYKRNEEQLRLQAEILNSVTDAVFMMDMTFTITMWNRGAEKLYGWSANEMIGQVIEPYEHSLLNTTIIGSDFQELLNSLYEHGTWQGEMVQSDKNGHRIPILSSLTLVRDASGRKRGIAVINRDISAQKEAEQRQRQIEEELQHAKHMESIGRLAGGVAHNFNNLLTVVQGYADLIQMQLPPDDPVQGDIEQILLASQRAAVITRHLLAVGRKQVLTPMVFDINHLIETIYTLLERVLGDQFTFTLKLDPDLKPVLADAGQLEEMFTNMILNARDAMPNGGELTIESQMAQPQEVENAHLPDGDYIKVSISDTGIGMEPEIMKHIFEPFFTTKSSSQGNGLGLATVYGAIKQHNGEIQVVSTPGVGTTFTIYLPVGDPNQHLSLLPVQAQPNEAPGGNETVLLVENNLQVRQLIHETLQGKGYCILEANSYQEAASVIQSYPHQIDLMIKSATLMYKADISLTELLKQQRPQAKVIIVSGHSDEVVRNTAMCEDCDFLPKPFTAHTLAMKVREVLDK